MVDTSRINLYPMSIEMKMDGAMAARLNEPVFVISVAARLVEMHPQTLRIYERKGLLDPARTGGGSRRYSEADIARLQRIQELTTEGLNLAGVKRVLELDDRLHACFGGVIRPALEEHGIRIVSLADASEAERREIDARFHEQEAHIVAQAGRLGAVTIATNMAGRGTDIQLGAMPTSASPTN